MGPIEFACESITKAIFIKTKYRPWRFRRGKGTSRFGEAADQAASICSATWSAAKPNLEASLSFKSWSFIKL